MKSPNQCEHADPRAQIIRPLFRRKNQKRQRAPAVIEPSGRGLEIIRRRRRALISFARLRDHQGEIIHINPLAACARVNAMIHLLTHANVQQSL